MSRSAIVVTRMLALNNSETLQEGTVIPGCLGDLGLEVFLHLIANVWNDWHI